MGVRPGGAGRLGQAVETRGDYPASGTQRWLLGPETAARGQERRQRRKEDNKTDGKGVYRKLPSDLMWWLMSAGMPGNHIRHACGVRQ